MSSFNPRICKRCDSNPTHTTNIVTGFNPRICKRCDNQINNGGGLKVVSIHASVKDATL